MGQISTGILWVEAIDAANTHTEQLSLIKNFVIQNIRGTQIEKPQGSLTFVMKNQIFVT
jgi:hypothetical protein